MTKDEIIILGSGDTLGTPVAGCSQAACTDDNPKSKRYRFGLLLRLGRTTILVDPNPDLKWQCLDNAFALKEVDHILVTHHHSDHVNGLGEFFYRRQAPTQLWYDNHPLNEKLVDYWRYLEHEEVLTFKAFTNYESFRLSDAVEVIPIELNHGFPTSGFVIVYNGKKIAVVTDTNAQLNERTLSILQGADMLFADAFSEDIEQVHGVYDDCGIPAPDLATEWFHMTMPEVQSLKGKVHARKTYTVHMSRHLSPHQQLVDRYQTDDLIIGWDGLRIHLYGKAQ